MTKTILKPPIDKDVFETLNVRKSKWTPPEGQFVIRPTTVIPNNEGLQALKHFFDQGTTKEPSTETLLRLAELVLTLNCFSFSGNFYKQVNGAAMGTKIGPNYAKLFVGHIENQLLNQYTGPKPELFGRYIDDCFGAASCTKDELNQFIIFVNSFHPALKFTHGEKFLNLQSLF